MLKGTETALSSFLIHCRVDGQPTVMGMHRQDRNSPAHCGNAAAFAPASSYPASEPMRALSLRPAASSPCGRSGVIDLWSMPFITRSGTPGSIASFCPSTIVRGTISVTVSVRNEPGEVLLR